MSNASDLDAINAYFNANPGRTGAAVAAFTDWVVWNAKRTTTTDADVAKARQLLDAFDVAQGGKPLAPGYYWIDTLSADALALFTAWRRAYGVVVRKTTEDAAAHRAWLLFEVKTPALWSLGTQIGRPTPSTKDADVTAAGGAELAPNVLDQVAEKLSVDNLASFTSGGLKVAAVVGAVALLGWGAVVLAPQLASLYHSKKL